MQRIANQKHNIISANRPDKKNGHNTKWVLRRGKGLKNGTSVQAINTKANVKSISWH